MGKKSFLEEAVYQAALKERARILALLEEHNNCHGGLSYGDCTCAAIALIEKEAE